MKHCHLRYYCKILFAVLCLFTAVGHSSTVNAQIVFVAPDSASFITSFGEVLSGIGDINNNGYGDVVIGNPSENVGGLSSAGAVYIYDGLTGNSIIRLVSPNPVENGRFGFDVTRVPDINEDGVEDVLVGAFFDQVEGAQSGRVYVFSGASGALVHSISSPDPSENFGFGYSVSSIPDVNLDGIDDLLIGESFATVESEEAAGRAHVYSGRSGLLLFSVQSDYPEERTFFSLVLHGVSDVDGDGRGDILSSDVNGNVFVHGSGPEGLLYTFSIESPFASDNRYRLTSISDINGDNSPEIIVGFPKSGRNYDRLYVFNGADGELIYSVSGDLPGGDVAVDFGQSVAGIEDIDEDGLDDIVVGASNNISPDGYGFEQVYFVSGASGSIIGSVGSPYPLPESEIGGFGMSVSSVPMSTASGASGIAVGAPFEGEGTRGRAYLFTDFGGAVSSENDPSGEAGLSIAISPNPMQSQGRAYVSVAETGPMRVEVVDLLGRVIDVVYEGLVLSGAREVEFGLPELASGIYVIRLVTRTGSASRQISVVR